MTSPRRKTTTHLGALLVAAIAIAPIAPALAADGTVAVVPTRGTKKAGPRAITRALRAVFKNAGYTLVSEKALKRAAKEQGVAVASAEAASGAGADLLVTAAVKRRKKRYQLTVKLFDADSGEVLHSAKQRFKRRKSGPKVARKLGRKLLPFAAEAIPEEEPEEEEATDRGPVIAADEAEPAPEPALDAPEMVQVQPKDESIIAQTAEVTPASKPHGRPIFEAGVGSGTQAGTAYTVSVADEVTALAYRLSPLFLLQLDLRLNIPDTDLSVEFSEAIATVKYALDTEPVVEPANPGGVFSSSALTVGYAIGLLAFGETGSLEVEPILGASIDVLSVQEQAPHSIVLSTLAFTPHVGVRPRVRFADAFDITVDARLRIVAAYSESPTKTGDSGFGLGTSVGARARYFITPMFGVSLGVAYEYTQITFSDEGDRPKFVGDPPLVNASIFSENFKVGLGLALAI